MSNSLFQVYMTVVLLLVPLLLMTALYGQVISSLRTGIRMDIAATENSVVDNDSPFYLHTNTYLEYPFLNK